MKPRTATGRHFVRRAAGAAHKPGDRVTAGCRRTQPIAAGMAPLAQTADQSDDRPDALPGGRSGDDARARDRRAAAPPCRSVARCGHRIHPGSAHYRTDLQGLVRRRRQGLALQALVLRDAVSRNGWWRCAATCAAGPKGARPAVQAPRFRRAQTRARPERCQRDQAATRHGHAACVLWRIRSCAAQSPLFARIPTSLRQAINSWVTNG